MADIDYRRLFEDKLNLIEEVVRYASRRRRFTGQEADDFRSYVHLKLIDQDYAVLRKFQGKSSLKTYLVAVTVRLGLDFRIEKWGKWRPSRKAERSGSHALLLERLVYRDGHTLEEAIEIMRTNHGILESPESLRELAAQIPKRTPRRFESEDSLVDLPQGSPPPDQALVDEESRVVLAGVRNRLQAALRTLETEDRLIVRMRYEEGLTVSTIARTLALQPKPLYRRFERVLGRLKSELEKSGVSADQVREVLADFADLGRETP